MVMSPQAREPWQPKRRVNDGLQSVYVQAPILPNKRSAFGKMALKNEQGAFPLFFAYFLYG
jgi:hypothetical protein